MTNGGDGQGRQPARPDHYPPDGFTSVASLLPDADWFWESLQRFCVPGCCGLAAYDLSATSVAWACGWGVERPAWSDWRHEEPGDPWELAAALRAAAREIRALDVVGVTASVLGDGLTPESCAELLEDLAVKAEPR